MRFRLLAVSVVGIGIVAGCASSQSGYSEADKQAFEKRTGADEAKGEAFVKQLEGLPPEQRAAYMSAHPADVRNMAIVPNRELQMRFRKLVTNKT
jgi:hypothetical protein